MIVKKTRLCRRVRELEETRGHPAKAKELVAHSPEQTRLGDSSTASLEGKLLQFQLMLPHIIREWESRRMIHQSNGTRATLRDKNVTTHVEEDEQTLQEVTLDEAGRVYNKCWKLLPARI